MSQIDSHNHVHCATFLVADNYSLPIYWPLENIDDIASNLVTSKDLLIGGGSGEHPALQIKNADLLVLWHVFNQLDSKEEANDPSIGLIDLIERIDALYLKKMEERGEETTYRYNVENFISLNDWPLSTWHLVSSQLIKFNSIERLFLSNIAQITLEIMPEQFYDPDIWKIIKNFKQIPDLFELNFSFQLAQKKSCSGKIIKNGTVQWGYCIENYLDDNQHSQIKKPSI